MEQLQSNDPSANAVMEATTAAQQMIVIRGLNRHLELRRMAEQLKLEKEQREREAFSVRGVDKYRRPEDASTIVQVRRFIC